MAESTHQEVVEVGELTHYIKHVLEGDVHLQGIQVQGEVANLTYHRSGHVYFTLKDEHAQVAAVMFKMYAQAATRLEVGDEIIAKGDITVYVPRGNYQLLVKKVRKAGTGDLFQQFVALREKLKAEGLFDPDHKKPIPSLPRELVVITSPTGAAVRDIVRTISRRYPVVSVKILPATVQGEGGAASIVKALKMAQSIKPDVIILGRGGGSLEDLWNFNEEHVARAIYDSPIPIITGIGHESDFTIADFVADFRASTPTAAAEKAVPELASLTYTLNTFQEQFQSSLQHFLDVRRQILDDYTHRYIQAGREHLTRQRHTLALLSKELEGLDMRNILERGYTLTLKNGIAIESIRDVLPGDIIETILAEGKVVSKIQEVHASPDKAENAS